MACGRLNITRFHVLIFAVWQLGIMFCNQTVFPIFLNYKPEWSCPPSDLDWSQNCTVVDICPAENLTFRSPYYSAAMEFHMVCGLKAYQMTLVSTITYVGLLVGAIGFGQLSDMYGRKPVVVGMFAFGMTASVATALAKRLSVLALFRFCVGCSVGGVLNVLFTYTMEMILPEQRVFMKGFINWGWGRMFLSVCAYLLPHWRTTSYLFALVLLPPFFLILIVLPESTKWLESKHQQEKLMKAKQWIAKFNGKPLLIEEIPDWQEVDKKVIEKRNERVYSVKDLFATSSLTRTTLTLWTMWFATSLAGYTNDLNSATLAGGFFMNQVLFSLLIGVTKFLIVLLDFTLPQFNRRVLHQGSQTLVIICYAIIILLVLVGSEQSSVATTITILSLLGTVLIEFTWDANYICAAELFPTVIRSLGVGSASAMARIGCILAPQMAYLRNLWAPAPFVTVAGMGLISLIVSFKFLRDTKGEELMSDISMDEKAANAVAETQKLNDTE